MAELITDEQEMLEYVKLNLGMPVVNVEMADEQFITAINDAALEFQRYAGGEGNFQEYCVLNISAGTSFYPVSAVKSIIDNGDPVSNVQSVSDIQLSTGLDNISALFSPSHILLIESGQLMYPNGSSFGPLATPSMQGQPLSQYYTAIGYLKQVQELFQKTISIRYLQGKQMLQTIPSPTTSGPCIILLTRGYNLNEMYNYPNFRKLSIARCMLIYARILRKYGNTTLPDGISLNASDVMSEAKELYAEAIKDIKSEQPPIDFFIG